MDVEDILDCHSRTEEVSTDGVHDTLGLTSGARCLLNTCEKMMRKQLGMTDVEDKETVLRREEGGRAVVRHLGGFVMPPLVPTLSPRYFVSSTLEYQDVLNMGAPLKSFVCQLFDSNSLAATAAFVGGENNARLAVVDAVAKRLR